MSAALIVLFFALACFLLKAFGVNTGRVDCGWLGIAFLVLYLIIT